MKSVQSAAQKAYHKYPEKILQFGEGNFLRAFADWMIDNANENGDYRGSIVICQPISRGLAPLLNEQGGFYTLIMRGLEQGELSEKTRLITSVSRCINPYEDYDALLAIARSADLEVVISNTTEAGIAYVAGDALQDTPPSSFPAKITALLFERFNAFHGAIDKGLLFLPVELIDQNGSTLKRIVLQYAREWGLGGAFCDWIESANKFANTLVDRIVTGYPAGEADYFENKLGYKDKLIVTSELFNLWVIEGPREWAEILPIHNNEANVLWTKDASPYKTRKVRILNGAHTSCALAAYLAGYDTVRDFISDPVFEKFLNQTIFDEIIPTLDLPRNDLENFASAVKERFSNPYIHHKLLDISLNSCSKFNARCLPSLLTFIGRNGRIPDHLAFSLAALIEFYKGSMLDGKYIGHRSDGTGYEIRDDSAVLQFFDNAWKTLDVDRIVHSTLGHESFWGGRDLNGISGLTGKVAGYLRELQERPVERIVTDICKREAS